MGYKYQVISDTKVPLPDELPKWFRDRYEEVINFVGISWVSETEESRDGLFDGLERDIQKVIRELGSGAIRLVFFADESDPNHPDVIHVTIDRDSIVELWVSQWSRSAG